MAPTMGRRAPLALLALLLCFAAPSSAIPFKRQTVQVYRIWESMSEDPGIELSIPEADEDMDDFLDLIEAEIKRQHPLAGDWRSAVNNIVTRDGKEISSLNNVPEKVFVLCMGETFFYPTDKIGEKFTVKIPHASAKKTVDLEVLSNTPQLLLVKDFLSEEECNALIESSKPKLQRSTVLLDEATGHFKDRSSTTAWFTDSELDMIPQLKDRVEDLTKTPPGWSESLQVLRYSPNQHYYVHHDFITAYHDDPRWSEGYNRMMTVFFYLSTVEEGGETVFPYANVPKDQHDSVKRGGSCEEFPDALKVKPVRGHAIIFYHTSAKGQQENQFLDLDETTLHGGCDPISGEKWAANFWIRNGPFHQGVAKPAPRRRTIRDAAKKGVVPLGVDYSWPTHNYEKAAAERMSPVQAERYKDFMEGCTQRYSHSKCMATERVRVQLNRDQPAQMVNYTRYGFEKRRVPDSVWGDLKKWWEDNKHNQRDEQWPAGNTFVNHWIDPATMVNFEDPLLQPLGRQLQQRLWDAVQEVLEQWTGMRLRPKACYGIRVYKGGHILSPHVDRQPLITSAIINVDQDVDEDWLLEVIGHDGLAHNVSMKPGDLTLYESHSIIHGRPYPMKGRYYANIFVHFEPYSPYVRYQPHPNPGPGREPPVGFKKDRKPRMADTELLATADKGASEAHYLAGSGAVAQLEQHILEMKDEGVHNKPDEHGWQPIHEGARSGNLDVVKLLIKHGANANERTHQGKGFNALEIARQYHGDDVPLVKYLEKQCSAVSEGGRRRARR